MRQILAATLVTLSLAAASVASAAEVTFVMNNGDRHTGQLFYDTGTNICDVCGFGQSDATCTDTCYTQPTCADATRTTFSATPTGNCGQFGTQVDCEAGYALGSCGAESCFWNGVTCANCTFASEQGAACTNTCGPRAAPDSALATIDPATNSKYSWKLFTYSWTGATPGEHTLVSRVTDVTGAVQPTAEALENKKTFLEDNSQHPRKVMIA